MSTEAVATTMATLAFYAGRWQCTTTEYTSPGVGKTSGPAATVRVERVLDGNWYKVEMDIAPGKDWPTGWHTQEFKASIPPPRNG